MIAALVLISALIGYAIARKSVAKRFETAPDAHTALIQQLAELEVIAETGTTRDNLNQALIEFRAERKLHPLEGNLNITANLIDSTWEQMVVLMDAQQAYIIKRGEDPARVTSGPNADSYQIWREYRDQDIADLKQFPAELRAELLTNGPNVLKSGN